MMYSEQIENLFNNNYTTLISATHAGIQSRKIPLILIHSINRLKNLISGRPASQGKHFVINLI